MSSLQQTFEANNYRDLLEVVRRTKDNYNKSHTDEAWEAFEQAELEAALYSHENEERIWK